MGGLNGSMSERKIQLSTGKRDRFNESRRRDVTTVD